jgi:putative aminopeptidase FrvX
MLVMEASEKFLHDYLNSCAPPGKPDNCRELWISYVEPVSDRIVRDAYGSVAAVQGEGPPTIVLEAHSDEIAWLVNYISDAGYIYVVQSGGSDAVIAPSKKATIYTRTATVPGVFAWPSQAQRGQADDAPKVSNLFLDVGCASKEEVLELGIGVGDPILFDDTVTVLNDRLYCGRALDNRVGGYIIAEVARKLRQARRDLPYSFCAVNSVQEEVGLRGAEMMANRLRPNLAIVVDVMNDTNIPRDNKTSKGDIAVGRGPVVPTAPPIHPVLLEKFLAVAAAQRIDVQRLAMSGSTGTDADAFAYSGSGVPTLLACVPIKYMHTTVECAHKADLSATIDLLYHFIVTLDFDELERADVFGRSYPVPAAVAPSAEARLSATRQALANSHANA